MRSLIVVLLAQRAISCLAAQRALDSLATTEHRARRPRIAAATFGMP
jgi:hypothetical protein